MSATPPFAPRTISFDGCRTDAEAMARLEQVFDDLEASTVRAYAASLVSDADIDDAEFQHCLAQFRQSLARFRDETRDERRATFRQMIDAARRPNARERTSPGRLTFGSW
jgi:hypothetical protein